MSKTILVAGSANLDFVVRASHVPAAGETVLGREFSTFPGGKGANQAVACARAGGAATRMLLALGDDPYAAVLESSLRSAAVGLHIVRTPDVATGTAFICLADNAENAITVAPGANNQLRDAHLPMLDDISHLLLQFETPIDTVTAYAATAHAAGVTVVLNAAPAHVLSPALLATVDVLIVNEGELATITATQGSVCEALLRLSVPCVVATLGARGVCARAQGQFHLQTAYRVDAVDSTGAGDTFCGVFVAALCANLEFEQALARACAAAALATTRLGAQAGIPTYDEVEKFQISHAPMENDRDALRELAAYCGLTEHA